MANAKGKITQVIGAAILAFGVILSQTKKA
jgi:hypothetical protein